MVNEHYHMQLSSQQQQQKNSPKTHFSNELVDDMSRSQRIYATELFVVEGA
jgi:hypothetical protein